MFAFLIALLSKPNIVVPMYHTPSVSDCILRNLESAVNTPLSELRDLCVNDPFTSCIPQPNHLIFLSSPDYCTSQRKLNEVQPDENELTPTEIERQKLMELLQMIPRSPSPPSRPPPLPPSKTKPTAQRNTVDNETQLALLGSLGAGMCALGCFFGAIFCGYRMYVRSKTIVPPAIINRN